MSVICPGASTVGSLWHNLARGVDSITAAPGEVIEPVYFESGPTTEVDRLPGNRGGFVDPAIADPLRYGFLPVAAQAADPDQLISLMLVEEALDDAGIGRDQLDRAGIIIGRGNYAGLPQLRGIEVVRQAQQVVQLLHHAVPELSSAELKRVRQAYQQASGRYQSDTATAIMPNLVASMVANHFDMHGPAYTVDAACASGIVALQHASRLLVSGECDVGLVGAMHTVHSAVFWSIFHLMGAMSRQQVIAPFSQDADGLLVGQGAGFLVIKTLRQALADDNRIYAVVKGTAVGSDGGGHSVLITDTVGQAKVLRAAWNNARLDPAEVAYVEAHGTGTPLGDAVEVETLRTVFGDQTHRRAYLGSVKSNIGHLMPAAGMLGLIKTALALHHRQIPATLHCQRPLPVLATSRFTPVDQLMDWQEAGLPLIAGVDAFGFGGINAHAVLTGFDPAPTQQRRYRVDRRRHASPDVLVAAGASRDELLSKVDPAARRPQLGSLTGEPSHRCRLVVFNPDRPRLAMAVDIVQRGLTWLGRNDIWYTEQPLLADGGQMACMFPGWDPVANIERASLADELGLDWQDWPDDPDHPRAKVIADGFHTSMLVHQGLRASGIHPDIYVGHSIGEWYAARALGMLDDSYDDHFAAFAIAHEDQYEAIEAQRYRVVVANGDLDQADLAPVLARLPGVHLSLDNCPHQQVYSAVDDQADQFIAALHDRGLTTQLLPWSIPIHSELMEPYLDASLAAMDQVTVHPGPTPLLSAVTLHQTQADGRTAAEAFGHQLSQPIRFRQAIELLWQRGVRVFVQCGVGSLTNFVEDTLQGRPFATIAGLSPLRSSVDQLRRVHALMFIMGGACDLTLMGVRPLHQRLTSIYPLPMGAPIKSDLPVLDEVMDRVRTDWTAEPAPAASVTPSGDGPAALAGGGPAPIGGPTPTVTPPVSGWAWAPGVLPPRGFTRTWAGHRPATVVPDVIRDRSQVPGRPATEMARIDGGSPSQGTPGGSPAKPTAPPVAPRRAGTRFEVPLELSLADQPYLMDHAIVNQPPGWPHADEIYPVVPMTMSMELLAEIAQRQAPGLKVVKIGPATAMDFLRVNHPVHAVVKGCWTSDSTVSLTIPGKVMMDITVAEDYPVRPAGLVADMVSQIGAPAREPDNPAGAYSYSFHGPGYRSLRHCALFGQHGFVCGLRRAAGKGSLLDNMGQMVGLFLHYYAPDNKVSFPVRVQELTFYQDMFDQDGDFTSYTVMRQTTDDWAVADVAYARAGQVWALARGWANQRVHLDTRLTSGLDHPGRAILSTQIAPGVFLFDYPQSSRSTAGTLAMRYLSAGERQRMLGLATFEAQRDFGNGRIAVKDAVRWFVRPDGGELLYPIQVRVAYDEHGKPVVRQDDGSPFPTPVEVSLSHRDGRAVAMVADRPVGVDIERVEPKDDRWWDLAFSGAEQSWLRAQDDPVSWAIRFWVAKEACAKLTGTGLSQPRSLVVEAVSGQSMAVAGQRVDTLALDTHIVGWTAGRIGDDRSGQDSGGYGA
jgi:3-oxoacyl-(acyl-carrier-protein) synthase/malonyl CoA-acyl carrier protein transacylase/phosphopantetheinyl transferase (holo-ACP synthase)